MGALRKLASQTALYGLSSVIGRLINWLLTPVFVNVFAPEAFGVLQDLYAFTFYPLIILTFGMETAFFRWAEEKNYANQAYTNALVTVGVLALGFGVLFGGFHQLIAVPMGYAGQGHFVLLIVGIILFDSLAALPMARLRFREKARRFALISLLNVGITVVLNLFFLFGLGLQDDVSYVLLANLIASAVRLGFALVGNLPETWQPDPAAMRKMQHYGLFIMIAGLAGALNETLDRNLLPRLWPEEGALWRGQMLNGFEMNGIYGAVYKLGMFVALATQAFRYAAEPFFFRNAREKNSPRTFARIFHYYFLATLAMFLLIASFRYEIVAFNFFGLFNFHLIPREYWVGLEAVPVILAANVCLGAYLNISIWFKLTKQVRYALLFTGVGAAVTVLGNVLFIPEYGYMACAWATFAAYFVMLLLNYLFGQRNYPIPYRFPRLLLYTALAVILVLINDAITGSHPPPAILSLAKLILCGALVLGAYALETAYPMDWPTTPQKSDQLADGMR